MTLITTRRNRILHLTLNRPEKRNALTFEMCRGLVEAIDAVQNDHEIGCIEISAEGPVFCSGMDLDEALSPESTRLAAVHERLFTIGQQSLKPLVIAVNGAAMGGGLGLVAQGHIVVAEDSSSFALSEVRIGLWPFLVYRALEVAVGPRRTLALSLSGTTFHAHQALAWGLVAQVCPDDEVKDRARSIARDLAKGCPAAISAGMQYLKESRGKSWEEAGQIASRLRDDLMAGPDFAEGVAAFKARREPHWPSMPEGHYKDHEKRHGTGQLVERH